MIETFAIPLTFMIIASLALWVIIGSKGWWILKATAVVIASLFCITLWNSLDDLQGWATNDKVPAKFEIKWISVEEPNKKTDAPGAIYLWIKDSEPDKTTHSWYISTKHKNINEESRLHKMPYSRKGHEQAVKIQQRIAKGEKFMAGNGENDGKGGMSKYSKDKNKKGGKSGGGMTEGSDEFNLYELPPPSYPQKLLE